MREKSQEQGCYLLLIVLVKLTGISIALPHPLFLIHPLFVLQRQQHQKTKPKRVAHWKTSHTFLRDW